MCGANTDKERGAAAAHTKTKKGRVVLKESYKPLLTPWKIGKVEIKNRIVLTSMGGTDLFGWMEVNHFDKDGALHSRGGKEQRRSRPARLSAGL